MRCPAGWLQSICPSGSSNQGVSRRGGRAYGETTAAACRRRCSRQFRRPAPLALQILRPAAAAMGELVAMGDRPPMQMAGQCGMQFGPGWCRKTWQVIQRCRLRLERSTASASSVPVATPGLPVPSCRKKDPLQCKESD